MHAPDDAAEHHVIDHLLEAVDAVLAALGIAHDKPVVQLGQLRPDAGLPKEVGPMPLAVLQGVGERVPAAQRGVSGLGRST